MKGTCYVSYSHNKRHKIKQTENCLKDIQSLIHRAIQKTITDLESENNGKSEKTDKITKKTS